MRVPCSQQQRETESEEAPGEMDTESSRKRKELSRDGSFNAAEVGKSVPNSSAVISGSLQYQFVTGLAALLPADEVQLQQQRSQQ